MIHNCKDGFGFRVDYRVDLYAKLGLHRYNMLKVWKLYIFSSVYIFLGTALYILYSLVNLYISWFNSFLICQGTNFQLDELIKFNMLMNMVSAYHITLVASDPASGSVLTFQVKVEEHMVNRLNVTVSIARPKGGLCCIVHICFLVIHCINLTC